MNGNDNVHYGIVIKIFCMLISLQGQATPLLIAAENGHASIVDILLAHGANVNHMEAVSHVICNIHVLLRIYYVCLIQ